MADEQPIVIIKKKGGHPGHHGGAWKVAYSDFITSMMCFFLVMWLVTTASGPTKKGISEYFKNPGIFDKTQSGSPLALGAAGIFEGEGVAPRSKETEDIISRISKSVLNDLQKSSNGEKISDEDKKEVLESISKKLKEQFEEKLEENADELKLGKGSGNEIGGPNDSIKGSKSLKDFLGDVEITVDGSSINIDIIDTGKVSMFLLGSSQMQREAKDALYTISKTLKDFPNEFEIVGHTDSVPYSGRKNYSNWELSSERANAARRILEDAGVNPNKIISVTGRADKDLKYKDNPTSFRNRRITLKMHFENEQLLDLSSINK